MDKFVTVLKPSTAGRALKSDKGKKRATNWQTPYDRPKSDDVSRNKRRADHERFLIPLLKGGIKPSSAAIMQHLLRTLSDDSNPITHSDSRFRAGTVKLPRWSPLLIADLDHVTSTATGHQRSDMRIDRKAYLEHRSEKLEEQSESPVETQVLTGAHVHINGFLSGTTEIELRRLVMMSGGKISQTASGATHIVTSHQLSGSKTHKMVNTSSKIKVHVVRPEWVIDSIRSGVRKPEREYNVLKLGGGNLDNFVTSKAPSNGFLEVQ